MSTFGHLSGRLTLTIAGNEIDMDPLSEPEPDWLDAPAVIASTDFCDDRRVYAPEEGTDRQTWRCACCAEPQPWTSLRDVTPLYPREGTDA